MRIIKKFMLPILFIVSISTLSSCDEAMPAFGIIIHSFAGVLNKDCVRSIVQETFDDKEVNAYESKAYRFLGGGQNSGNYQELRWLVMNVVRTQNVNSISLLISLKNSASV